MDFVENVEIAEEFLKSVGNSCSNESSGEFSTHAVAQIDYLRRIARSRTAAQCLRLVAVTLGSFHFRMPL